MNHCGVWSSAVLPKLLGVSEGAKRVSVGEGGCVEGGGGDYGCCYTSSSVRRVGVSGAAGAVNLTSRQPPWSSPNAEEGSCKILRRRGEASWVLRKLRVYYIGLGDSGKLGPLRMVSSGEGGTDEKVVVARKRELPYAHCHTDVMPESCPRRCELASSPAPFSLTPHLELPPHPTTYPATCSPPALSILRRLRPANPVDRQCRILFIEAPPQQPGGLRAKQGDETMYVKSIPA
jgi:hypothetical protein